MIILFALTLRVGFILTLDNSVDVWGDWWDELGWKLATGQGYWVNNPYFSDGQVFYSWRAPGFPLFLALIYKIFGHSFLAAKIALAMVSSFTCLILYLLARRIFRNNKIAAFTGFIYVFYPPAIFWTGYLAPVTLEIFFSVLIVYLFYSGVKKLNFLNFLFAGIILGLGVLTRSLFIVFLPIVFLWLILYKGWLFSLKATALTFFLFFLTVFPWAMRNFKIHGKLIFTSTEGGIVCYIANNEKSLYQPSGYWDPTGNINEPVIKQVMGLSELEANSFFYKAAFKFIKENPGIYVRLVKDRFLRFWKLAPHTFSGPGENYKKYHVFIALITNLPIFIFAGLGFLLSLKKFREYSLLYLTVLLWSLPIIMFFKTVIRYREPIMPFVILLAVEGICGLSSFYKRKKCKQNKTE